ncbi:hypothetical protein IJI76_03195 [Candidatus Saccharibacteria bacterium]|nr:hypothetical protein [Candidatus Saccharibacteria bacterium]
MIHIFYGEDRLNAEKSAKKILGENYEVVDAENLSLNDLPTLFLGTSLFDADARKILIKGLSEKKELFDELEKYEGTPHEIIVLEDKINGNWTSFKNLKKSKKVDVKEFEKLEKIDRFLAFNIFSTALIDPKKAYTMLKKAEETEDPYMMVGAWTTSALKTRKKSAIKELSKIDILLKTTNFSNNPWPVLETYILRLKNL